MWRSHTVCTTSPTHLIVPELISLIMFVEDCSLWNPSLNSCYS
jgi:hypothetical protein